MKNYLLVLSQSRGTYGSLYDPLPYYAPFGRSALRKGQNVRFPPTHPPLFTSLACAKTMIEEIYGNLEYTTKSNETVKCLATLYLRNVCFLDYIVLT